MKMQEVRITAPMQDGWFTISPYALKNVKGTPIVKYIGNEEVPIGFVESAKVDEATNHIEFVGQVWSAGVSFRESEDENGDGKLFKISSVNI